MDWDKFNAILVDAKKTSAGHSKLAKKLVALFSTIDIEQGRKCLSNVINHIVTFKDKDKGCDRLVQFIAVFCKLSGQTLLDSKQDSVSTWLLKKALTGLEAGNKTARLRMIQLTGDILEQFDETECRLDLRIFAAQKLIDRVSDAVAVNRAASLEALVPLQNEDGVLGAYTEAMEDQNSTVRKTALKFIDLSVHGSDHILLQSVLQRLSDVSPLVQTMAFKQLSTISMNVLDRNDIQALLAYANSHDKCWELLRRWLASMKGDWLALLRRCRVVQNEDLVAEVLLKCAPEMKFKKTFFKQYIDSLTNESVLLWRVYCQWCSTRDVFDYTPDLTVFAQFVEGYIDTEYQFRQLLLMIPNFDMADEAGRREASRCLRDLVVGENVPKSSLHAWLAALRATVTSEGDLVLMVLEAISELKTPSEGSQVTRESYSLAAHLAYILLSGTQPSLKNPGIKDLFQEVILPCIQSHMEEFKLEGFRCLGAYCLISPDVAATYLMVLLTAHDNDTSQLVRNVVLSAIIDIATVFGGAIQRRASGEPPQWERYIQDQGVPSDFQQTFPDVRPLCVYFLYLLDTVQELEEKRILLLGLWKIYYHDRLRSRVLLGRLLVELEICKAHRKEGIRELGSMSEMILSDMRETGNPGILMLLESSIPSALRLACQREQASLLCEAVQKSCFMRVPVKKRASLVARVALDLMTTIITEGRSLTSTKMATALKCLPVPSKPSSTIRSLDGAVRKLVAPKMRLPKLLLTAVVYVGRAYKALPDNFHIPDSVKESLASSRVTPRKSPKMKRTSSASKMTASGVLALAQKRKTVRTPIKRRKKVLDLESFVLDVDAIEDDEPGTTPTHDAYTKRHRTPNPSTPVRLKRSRRGKTETSEVRKWMERAELLEKELAMERARKKEEPESHKRKKPEFISEDESDEMDVVPETLEPEEVEMEEDKKLEPNPVVVVQQRKKHRVNVQVAFSSSYREESGPRVSALGGLHYSKNKWSNNTTHYVCGENTVSIMTMAARFSGAWLVNIDWFNDSVKDGSWQDEHVYAWAPHGPFSLFKGKKLHLTENFIKASKLRGSHLIKILKHLSNAHVVPRDEAHYVLVGRSNEKRKGESTITWTDLKRRMFQK